MRDDDLWSWVYTTDPNLRVGDADRETVANRLRGHHADGRLDTDELAERVDRCYHARTVGELEELLADLPRAPVAERSLLPRPEAWRLAAVIPTIVALAAISAATGAPVIWLAVPITVLARRVRRMRRRIAPTPAAPRRAPGTALTFPEL